MSMAMLGQQRALQRGLREVGVTHHTGEQIVAETLGALGQGVGRQGCNHHAVGPAPELYVQDGIPDLPPLPPLLLISCSAPNHTEA